MTVRELIVLLSKFPIDNQIRLLFDEEVSEIKNLLDDSTDHKTIYIEAD